MIHQKIFHCVLVNRCVSVRQHMILFARIKNQCEDSLVKDIVKIMKVMGLLEVADTVVQNLRFVKRKEIFSSEV